MPHKVKPSLDEVLAGIKKEHGSGSVMVLGEDKMPPVNVISTGSILLDEALGVGGFPRGRITEIFGPESSGKTSVALTALGNAQRMGLRGAIIDAEHALDPEWAAVLGVDTDKLIVSQPDFGEQGLQIADKLSASGHVGIIVIDSVAALTPKAELDGEIGDIHVGLQARMMSQALRKLTGQASDSDTAIIFINQLREKVGKFFGSSETQPGGKALKFYSSVRLDVRRVETLKEGGNAVGSRVRVRAVKNKVARPYGEAVFDFLFGHGISREGELIDLGVERGVVGKSGAWFFAAAQPCKLDDSLQLGQGKQNAARYLAEHKDVAALVEAAIRARPAPHKTSAPKEDSLDMGGPAPWDGDTV